MIHRPQTNWIPGPIRPKHEPPTIDEAIAAAQCFATSQEGCVEVAAELLGVSEDVIRAHLQKFPAALQEQPRTLTISSPRSESRGGGARTVVVERRSSRPRFVMPASAAR